ncbi:MAG: 1-acyl-sn-glycerol-3-phosphate acyltransferase [Nevskiaceae bacterium]|jgi:1-acyl-sn-glycerol-3-phosphate acyltransferase|nr:MAG: 1-acyl-sn-glycerol-3-phosphate acyltransferase [Nevskiaceae bacterium]TAM29016.1 MAG: 1-acyl-sn-glycerol-3-phosphate acyltransferase [Nevskiaceae bacterium]
MPARVLRTLSRPLYGAYATGAFALAVLPLCLMILVGPTLRSRRAIGRAGTHGVMRLIGCPIRVRGLEHLPEGPCVCVANHASYLDGMVLTAALPAHFSFLVQHGAANWPLVGPTIRRMGVSFVNRGSPREAAVATRDLLRRLHEGESFAIFAEGTFKAEPGLLPFQPGAFAIASRASVPVLPVVIRGTRAVFPEGARLPRRSQIEIEILPPLHPEGSSREAAHQLRDAVRSAILDRCGEPDTLAPAQDR